MAASGSESYTYATVPICDPHFHFWDTTETPNPNLGDLDDAYKVYLGKDYVADFAGLNLKSCVHVETCVGQVEGGFKLDTVRETGFVTEQADAALSVPYRIVPFVNLAADTAEVRIKEHLALSDKVVGVRMITNYVEGRDDLIYPQVPCNYLKGHSGYAAGLSLLDKYGLSLDLHVTTEQLPDAAAVLSASAPDSLKVVINHLACGPRLGRGAGHADADEETQWGRWREGLAAVAARPNTFMKLSGPTVVHAEWMRDDAARAAAKRAVAEAIALFGKDRCMVASNFPVDKMVAPCTAGDLYKLIFEAASDALDGDGASLKQVFHDTAASFYKLT